MTSMTCWSRAHAWLSQRRICAGCARFRSGEMHVGEIRLRSHLHILKINSIHFSATVGPALNRRCDPRMAVVAICSCRV